jgi:hypothetical protein
LPVGIRFKIARLGFFQSMSFMPDGISLLPLTGFYPLAAPLKEGQPLPLPSKEGIQLGLLNELSQQFGNALAKQVGWEPDLQANSDSGRP